MSCYETKDPVPSIAGQAVAGGTISAPKQPLSPWVDIFPNKTNKTNPLVDNLKYSTAKLTPLLTVLNIP